MGNIGSSCKPSGEMESFPTDKHALRTKAHLSSLETQRLSHACTDPNSLSCSVLPDSSKNRSIKSTSQREQSRFGLLHTRPSPMNLCTREVYVVRKRVAEPSGKNRRVLWL